MERKILLNNKLRKPVLALGGDLKGSCAIALGREVSIDDGFGDLADLDNFLKYRKAVEKKRRSLGLSRHTIVCDLHPGYVSSRYAEELCAERRDWCSLLKVQHHESHLASCLTEHGITGRTIGVAFDGTGYGRDGNVWGGEFFVFDGRTFRRVGRLEYLPMPGSDAAIREPWRMAASYLYRAFGKDFLKLRIDFVRRVIDPKKWNVVRQMIDKKIHSPLTSSAGRFFDAVSSLVLLKHTVAHEAEAAIALERIAQDAADQTYRFRLTKSGDCTVVDTGPVIKGVVRDMLKNRGAPYIAAKFHATIIEIIAAACGRIRRAYHIDKVLLSGGVFQNDIVLKGVKAALSGDGFRVYHHVKVPTSDSGLPLGQIALAALTGR